MQIIRLEIAKGPDDQPTKNNKDLSLRFINKLLDVNQRIFVYNKAGLGSVQTL